MYAAGDSARNKKKSALTRGRVCGRQQKKTHWTRDCVVFGYHWTREGALHARHTVHLKVQKHVRTLKRRYTLYQDAQIRYMAPFFSRTRSKFANVLRSSRAQLCWYSTIRSSSRFYESLNLLEVFDGFVVRRRVDSYNIFVIRVRIITRIFRVW